MNTGALPHELFMHQIGCSRRRCCPALQAHGITQVPAAAQAAPHQAAE